MALYYELHNIPQRTVSEHVASRIFSAEDNWIQPIKDRNQRVLSATNYFSHDCCMAVKMATLDSRPVYWLTLTISFYDCFLFYPKFIISRVGEKITLHPDIPISLHTVQVYRSLLHTISTISTRRAVTASQPWGRRRMNRSGRAIPQPFRKVMHPVTASTD